MRADAARRRRRQHPDPLRHLPRRRAGRALALRHRARVDRRRARRRAAQPARAARLRLRADLDASIVSSTVPQLEPEWTRDGRALPRPRDARRRPGHEDRHADPLSTTRARSAPTGSSTRSPILERFGGAVRRASTSAPRPPSTSSRPRGEYLGGRSSPGVEISLEALTERGARLPKIDLAPPRSVIGKSTVDAIRSGVVYGYAGAVDGILRRLQDELGERADVDRHRRPGRAHRARTREAIDEVDDLLTLTGLQAPARAQRPGARRLAWAPCPSCTDPWDLGGVRDPQPRRARAAGRHRQLVRAPAGQALRRRPRGLGDGLELRDPLPQREDARPSCCASTPTSAPAGRSRSSSSARTPRSCARPPRRRRARAPTSSTSTWAARCPKVCKTGAGAALLEDPDTAVAVARAAREGSRPAGHRQAALRPGAGRRDGVDARPPARRGGRRRPAIAFHPRSAAVHHKGTPDYELAARLVAELPVPGDPLRRPAATPSTIRRVFEHTGAAAVMLARGALGNPWLFAQVLGARDDEPTPRRGPRRARLGDRPRRRAPRRGPRRALPAQVLPLVRRRGWARAARLQDALQRTDARPSSAPCWRCSRRPARPSGVSPVGLDGRAVTCSPPRRTDGMPKDVILTPEGLEKLKAGDRVPLDHQAPRGRRAHQGGARVRRHLGELRVRRRQERAGDARERGSPSSRSKLRSATVIDAKELSTDVVRVGSAVHVKDEKTASRSSTRSSARPRPNPPRASSPTSRRSAGAHRPQAGRRRRGQRSPAARRASSRSPRSTSRRSRDDGRGAAGPASRRAELLAARRAQARARCAPTASTRSRTPSRASSRSRTVQARPRRPARRRGDRRALPRRRPPRTPAAARARWRSSTSSTARAGSSCRRAPTCSARSAMAPPARPRPRRPRRRRRPRLPLAPRRALAARRGLRRAGQVAAPAARQVPRADRRRDPPAPPRARPDRQRGGARARSPARARIVARDPPLTSTRTASSRSRRRSCSRSTAARWRGRSRPTTTRSTARSTCASPPSSTSSG